MKRPVGGLKRGVGMAPPGKAKAARVSLIFQRPARYNGMSCKLKVKLWFALRHGPVTALKGGGNMRIFLVEFVQLLSGRIAGLPCVSGAI